MSSTSETINKYLLLSILLLVNKALLADESFLIQTFQSTFGQDFYLTLDEESQTAQFEQEHAVKKPQSIKLFLHYLDEGKVEEGKVQIKSGREGSLLTIRGNHLTLEEEKESAKEAQTFILLQKPNLKFLIKSLNEEFLSQDSASPESIVLVKNKNDALEFKINLHTESSSKLSPLKDSSRYLIFPNFENSKKFVQIFYVSTNKFLSASEEGLSTIEDSASISSHFYLENSKIKNQYYLQSHQGIYLSFLDGELILVGSKEEAEAFELDVDFFHELVANLPPEPEASGAEIPESSTGPAGVELSMHDSEITMRSTLSMKYFTLNPNDNFHTSHGHDFPRHEETFKLKQKSPGESLYSLYHPVSAKYICNQDNRLIACDHQDHRILFFKLQPLAEELKDHFSRINRGLSARYFLLKLDEKFVHIKNGNEIHSFESLSFEDLNDTTLADVAAVANCSLDPQFVDFFFAYQGTLNDSDPSFTNFDFIESIEEGGFKLNLYRRKDLKFQIFSFRGTVSEQNGIFNVRSIGIGEHTDEDRVHFQRILEFINRHKHGNENIRSFMSGQSLGGFLAQVFAVLSETQGVSLSGPGALTFLKRHYPEQTQNFLDRNIPFYNFATKGDVVAIVNTPQFNLVEFAAQDERAPDALRWGLPVDFSHFLVSSFSTSLGKFLVKPITKKFNVDIEIKMDQTPAILLREGHLGKELQIYEAYAGEVRNDLRIESLFGIDEIHDHHVLNKSFFISSIKDGEPLGFD